LSAGHMIYDTLPATTHPPSAGERNLPSSAGERTLAPCPGDWDRFTIRTLGLAAARRIATRFDGDPARMRAESVAAVVRALGLHLDNWTASEKLALEDFSLVLALVPGLAGWPETEKDKLGRIVRAKAGLEESRYLKLLQRHLRLRCAIIKLGSQS
jgi:hypothetical protein